MRSLCWRARQLAQFCLDELDHLGVASLIRLPDSSTPLLDHVVSRESGRHADDIGCGQVSPVHRQVEARPVSAMAGEQRVHALHLSARPLPLDVEIQADQRECQRDRLGGGVTR
jgi:hypothetical protein